MKAIVIILALLLIVSCSRVKLEDSQSGDVSSTISTGQPDGVSSHSEELNSSDANEKENKSSGETPPIIHESELSPVVQDDWRLLLVNFENKISEDYSPELESTHGYMMDKRIVGAYNEMYDAAKDEGITLTLCYGYRTQEQSAQLFKKQIDRQMGNGLTREQAEIEAKKWVAPPGYSDHHTGLALDIVTPSNQVLNDEFAKTDAAIWMKDNAYKYGFVLRYPKDKQEITQITFEPWHYRFVGADHAKAMFDGDLCLEEYLSLK